MEELKAILVEHNKLLAEQNAILKKTANFVVQELETINFYLHESVSNDEFIHQLKYSNSLGNRLAKYFQNKPDYDLCKYGLLFSEEIKKFF